MSISSISSITGYPRTGIEIQWQQEMHDFQALAIALQSGDIVSVLKAFAAWQQDLQANNSANTQSAQQIQPFGSNTPANAAFPGALQRATIRRPFWRPNGFRDLAKGFAGNWDCPLSSTWQPERCDGLKQQHFQRRFVGANVAVSRCPDSFG